MASRPHIECPNCGSDRVLPLVFGFPSPELLDMAMQRFINLGGCTVDGSESVWSCDSCHHEWGSSANEADRELSRAMFAYIESVFVPTPPEIRAASQRERSFQGFMDTVVPQAIMDGASAIELSKFSITFVIEGKRVLVAPDPFVPQVIEAFQNQMSTDSTDSKTINVYSREQRVELGLARLKGGDGLEISLLGHDLAPEILAESSPRKRLPVCPYRLLYPGCPPEAAAEIVDFIEQNGCDRQLSMRPTTGRGRELADTGRKGVTQHPLNGEQNDGQQHHRPAGQVLEG